MISISIDQENIITGLTKNDILWHNLFLADKYHQLRLFIEITAEWLKENPTKKHQDLEKELRERNFNTHLFAKKPNNTSDNIKLYFNGTTVECDYECNYSCRPKELALKEVLNFWPSYESNFDALANSGNLVITNLEKAKSEMADCRDDKIEFFEKKSNTALNIYDYIATFKLKATHLDILDYLQSIIEKYEFATQNKTELKIIGLNDDGGPIVGIFDNKTKMLVSDKGLSIYHSGNNKGVLFDITPLYSDESTITFYWK